MDIEIQLPLQMTVKNYTKLKCKIQVFNMKKFHENGDFLIIAKKQKPQCTQMAHVPNQEKYEHGSNHDKCSIMGAQVLVFPYVQTDRRRAGVWSFVSFLPHGRRCLRVAAKKTKKQTKRHPPMASYTVGKPQLK